MKRTFIGIKVPAGNEMDTILSGLKNELNEEDVRWANSSNFHITLFFLGNVEDETIEAISSHLHEIAGCTKTFSLRIKGFGFFGKKEKPKVIWLGVEAAQILYDLQGQINECVENFGFIPEKSSYTPHLTIGRTKKINNPALFYQWIEKYKGLDLGEIEVSEMAFFESASTSKGPEYKAINKFKFQG
jgi:RNA 2',3'-cyclic 3'-phosphodiesterase